jgi:hypothetical protein
MSRISKHKFDTVPYGIAVGILGAALGFILFGLVFTFGTSTNLATFFHDLLYGITAMYQDKVVTISILGDVALFYWFIKKEWYQMSRGILYVVICSVPVALYFY